MRLLAGALSACVLVGCGGGGDTPPDRSVPSIALAKAVAPMDEPSLKIVSVIKVSEARVGPDAIDYVFRILVLNGPQDKVALTATITAAGPGTTVIDGSVLIGDAKARSTTSPSDTVTLRHTGASPFTKPELVWQITEPINGIAVPPAPDTAANQATLAGIDTNGNGVRDDIERLVATNFGADPQGYAEALAFAKTLQTALAFSSDAASEAYTNTFRCIQDTAKLTEWLEIEKGTLDTALRRKTYGQVFAGSYVSNEGC